MDNTRCVTYNQVHTALQKEAIKIQNNYKPDAIVAIGRGGYIPASIIRTWIDVPIFGVGIRLYGKDDKLMPGGPEKYQWLDEKSLEFIRGKKILLVDEVDDTRTTLHYCVGELMKDGVGEIAVLVLHNKLKPKSDLKISHYFACAEEDPKVWIVYPWESWDIYTHDRLVTMKPIPTKIK
jgi:uncharacterized protein